MNRTVSIVGAGRVGKTLGKRLRERGWRIGAVVTRSPATARAAVRSIGAGKPFGRLSGDLFAADVILFGTPDDELPAIARALAQIGGARCKGKVILHTSATLDQSALAPLARHGASTGSLHPMQAFGGKIIPNLRGVIFAMEGDPKARRMAQSMAKSLGGIPIAIATRDKPVYHAAAVMAGGSAYPVIEAGLQLLMGIGFTRARATQTLLPLTRQILDNIGRIGPRAAWTGPLSRGDYAIVAKHARALRRFPREIQQSYAALALLAGRVLAKDPDAALKRIKRALKV
ncbi:MAG TPA: Rossmann-like and DUF2520 domain-containing protein [Candidatus Acidoferrum sp.]|nr:Rossmann-like and DUF2520 domain-containing protein [Candidatus Acidoferrum sp.]